MSIVQMTVPNIGESITEVTINSFLVEEGDYVELDQSILEFDSDKATLELPAEVAGTVHFLVEEGQDLNIGDLVCEIDTSAAAPVASNGQAKAAANAVSEPPKAVEAATTTTYATGHPSPAAAKLIAENKIDATKIKGTGVDGRILKEDVLAFLESKPVAPAPNAKKESKATASVEVTPKTLGSRNSTEKKLSRLRKTISRRLVEVKNNTAMLTTFNEVDLTEIIALRKRYKEEFKEKHQIGLGYMGFFTKAASIALQEFPAVNAYIDTEKGIIEYHDYVDISIAVSSKKGLVVPVIRNVEDMGLKEIEQSIRNLAIKARDGKLTMEEMTGGTFTITNGGIFGSLLSTPIINSPQSAILGMHGIKDRPMAINGEVKIRPMMYLALSYDHRIIDGKDAVTFLVRIKNLLEDPMRLFLNL